MSIERKLYWFVENGRNLSKDERDIFLEFNGYTGSNVKACAERLNKEGFIKPSSTSGSKDNYYMLENLSIFPNSQDRFKKEYGEDTY